MVLKRNIVIGLLVTGVFVSTKNAEQTDYMAHYEKSMTEVLKGLEHCIDLAEQNSTRSDLLDATYQARVSMKRADFWLRYLEPLAYKKINGPLPIEWEVEVFEKWEKPYKRLGSGFTLVEELIEEEYPMDSILGFYLEASNSIDFYLADSLTNTIKTYDHFWYANRLHLLNLASIYTTGFECPNLNRVIPELEEMMAGTQEVYRTYNATYSDKPLSLEYQNLYNEALEFVSLSHNYQDFDHFQFIKNYVNPLFTLNQQQIRKYEPVSASFNDYSLSNDATSIFDKHLYGAVSTGGPYREVNKADKQRVIQLGEMLFHDPILSGNNQRSCASCHDATQGFTQTERSTSLQFDRKSNIERNTPSLYHAYSNHLLSLDGRQITALEQVREVVNNPEEMACSDQQVVEKVMKVKHYKKELKYLSRYTQSKELKADNIYASIVYYVSNLEQFNSKFDQAINGEEVSPAVIAGFNLFMGKAQCATCHFVPVFNGVKPPYVSSEFEVIGVPQDSGYTTLSKDLGRGKVHRVPEMQHAFRTPSVRNSSNTAPYMHNGVFNTLEQVLEFYNNGGGIGHGLQVENQSLASDSLKLNQLEIGQIVTFMHSLGEEVNSPSAEAIQFAKESVLGNRTFGGTY